MTRRESRSRAERAYCRHQIDDWPRSAIGATLRIEPGADEALLRTVLNVLKSDLCSRSDCLPLQQHGQRQGAFRSSRSPMCAIKCPSCHATRRWRSGCCSPMPGWRRTRTLAGAGHGSPATGCDAEKLTFDG